MSILRPFLPRVSRGSAPSPSRRPRHGSTRTGISAALAAVLASAGILGAAPIAAGNPATGSADTGSAAAAPFYTPPASITDSPGAVLRHEPMPLLLQIPGLPGSWPGSGTRVLYTSRTDSNTPVAVSGTLIQPTAPWRGSGERPTVVLGPGTVGQGDQCAPSRMFSTGGQIDLSKPSAMANYEIGAAYAWASLGVRVFVTDYVGLGTPGVHTYVNRAEEGHAMLDGARAALELAGAPADAPVGFWGYSQGGGAAASAAELAASYAPELAVKGSYAGAPPADLGAVLRQIDGTFIVGAIGYALNGFIERHPDLKDDALARLRPEGVAASNLLKNQCILDSALTFGFQKTSMWTRDGRPLFDHLMEIPRAMEVLDAQRIGRLRPSAPVLIAAGTGDDVIPAGQAIQLGRDWCAQGADVRMIVDRTPPILPRSAIGHTLPLATTGIPAYGFLMDRFNGAPVSSDCGRF